MSVTRRIGRDGPISPARLAKFRDRLEPSERAPRWAHRGNQQEEKARRRMQSRRAQLNGQERERLHALHRYAILDTPPEEAFDRITRLAARISGSRIALITFIDEGRQWFKSNFGWDITETPRHQAFYSLATLKGDVFVVPDASADPRLKDNPLVTNAPHIRFFAAAPLKTKDGHSLGALCVADRNPCEEEHESLPAMLRDLAALVMSELELRSEVMRRAAAERELDHRLKNTLATIQVLLRQAASRKGDKDKLVQDVSHRLNALARAHSLLNEAQSEGIELRRIFEAQLEPYREGRAGRLDCRGVPVKLSPGAALRLAVAVHEMIANSAVSGALSTPDGNVDIAWRVSEGEERLLRLVWTESGGPRVVAPAHTGYGVDAVERLLSYEMDATSRVAFRAEGLEWTFEAPLQILLSPNQHAASSAPGPAPRPEPGSEDQGGDGLNGAHILVVEDSAHIAFSLEAALSAAGANVVGPAATLDKARALAAEQPLDMAVVDINLNNELSFPLIHELLAEGVRVVISTGYNLDRQFPGRAPRDLPVLQKPYTTRKLLEVLKAYARDETPGNM